jgi:hypothetical protein
MLYEAEFETNLGEIRAVWDGGAVIHIYPECSECPTHRIDVWDHENDKPSISPNAKSMAAHVREWLWETERGIDFERIITREIDEFSDPDQI